MSGRESSASAVAEPYVGLRPFEREDAEIFFARDKDALFLVNKIQSAVLTLLYAQSGMGKSSLLRALGIPQLEEETEAVVLYFDAWASERPLDELKRKLGQLAKTLGVVDPLGSSPTLTELARLVTNANERPLVLVLDQFEEFLIRHALQLDPLRKELGALVRASDADTRVVVSLREEFLAALEPFRNDIVKLFASTYRLEPLDSASVREAIERPAALFGISYEPELLERLLVDLRSSEEGSTTPGKIAAAESLDADLPILQLVCSELWKRTRKDAGTTLTLSQYLALGGARAIVSSYVERNMPSKRDDRLLAARLMQYLAPASGLKQSYAPSELAEFTSTPVARVQAELERLECARILRIREYRGSHRFELQHDRFVGILRPWADKLRRQAARSANRRRFLAGGGAILLGILAFVAYRAVTERQRFRDVTENCWNEKNRTTDACFDNMVGYFFWKHEGPTRLDRLREQLERRSEGLPSPYGIDRSGAEFVQLVDDDEAANWPLVVRYSKLRKDFDEYAFTRDWQAYAKFIAEKWGVPVPKAVVLRSEPTFPARLFRIEAPGGAFFEDEIGTYEAEVYLSLDKLEGPANEFFHRFSRDWMKTTVGEKEYWIVPRWTLPVWKAAGRAANDGSGFPAFIIAAKLLQQPDVLLSKPAVEYLLAAAAKEHPQLVAEARAARGDRLQSDLAELVQRGLAPKHHLLVLLDLLASYGSPLDDSKAVLETVQSQLTSAQSTAPDQFSGTRQKRPSMKQPEQRDQSCSETPADAAYREVKAWLKPSPPQIRIYMGNEAVADELGADFDSTRAKIDALRDRFAVRFGFGFPGVRFVYAAPDDPAYDKRAFRLELLNQSEDNSECAPVMVKPGEAIDQILAHLRYSTHGLRVYWLDADRVYLIKEDLGRELKKWLEEHYSLTDLKILLRGVVNPEQPELDRRAAMDVSEQAEVPAENTIRHTEWLLRSLVFWAQVEPSPNSIIEGLLETQRARIAWDASATLAPSALVTSGVEALERGSFAVAGSFFARAVAQDRVGAIRTFLSTYPSQLHRDIGMRIEKACSVSGIALSREDRADAEEMLEAFPANGMKERRALEMCLVDALSGDHLKIERVLSVLERDRELPSWSAGEMERAARWLMTEIPNSSDNRIWSHMERLLQELLPRADERAAERVFGEFVGDCNKAGRQRRCFALAEKLASSAPRGSIPLDFANAYSRLEDPEAARSALSWLEKGDAYLQVVPRKLKAPMRVYALQTHAQALAQLAATSEPRAMNEARSAYDEIAQLDTDHTRWMEETIADAYVELAHISEYGNDLEGAGKWLAAASQRWPSNLQPLHESFWLAIDAHDERRAYEISQRSLEKFSPFGKPVEAEHEDVLFDAAVAQILTGRGSWEHTGRRFLLETHHPYRDYVAMMLYAFMGAGRDDAAEVLKDRWKSFEKQSAYWPERLRSGDPTAWREQLIGYYLDKVKRDRIFGPLDSDASFRKSDMGGLYLARQGLLSEAYFYDAMLAKARGNEARMRELLQKVVDVGYRPYLEYRMAGYLLARQPVPNVGTPPPPLQTVVAH